MGFFDFISPLAKALPIVGDFFEAYSDKRENDRLQDQFNTNVQMQREFAQHGLSWKAQDARDAGLHPLAALGASGINFQPVYVGGEKKTNFRDFGQDIYKAVDNRMNQAVLREAEAKAGIAEETLKQLKQGGQAGSEIDELGNKVSKNVSVKIPQSIGKEYGFKPLTVDNIDEYGVIWGLPNQNAQDALSEGPDSWKYAYVKAMRLLRAMGARAHISKSMWKELRDVRPHFENKNVLAVYSPVKANWVAVQKKSPFDAHLFLQKDDIILRGKKGIDFYYKSNQEGKYIRQEIRR